MTKTREKILNSLPYFSEMSLGTLLTHPDLQGIPYGTIRGALRDLRKSGHAVNDGSGWRRTV